MKGKGFGIFAFCSLTLLLFVGFNYFLYSKLSHTLEKLPADIVKLAGKKASLNSLEISDLLLYQHAQSYSTLLTTTGILLTILIAVFGNCARH